MEAVTTLARQFAASVAALRRVEVPAPVLDRAKQLLLDHLGNVLGGSRTPSYRAAAAALAHVPDGSITAVGHRRMLLPEGAALLNGVASHSLEMDDTHNTSSAHLGASVIPAALAVAEDLPAPPWEVLRALVAGYEVAGRLGKALGPGAVYSRGFHPTGVVGPLGAAAAAGYLLGLNQEELTNALGIAGSMSSGLMEFLADGSYAKRLHPGWAAQAGIVAARLARAGYTGPASVVEGQHGLLWAFSGCREASMTAGSWDLRDPEILKVAVKAHACCRYKQGPIDCVLEIVRGEALEPGAIERMEVGVLEAGWDVVVEPRERKLNPQSVVDAQFSMPYGAAVAAVRGRASLDEYSEEALADPMVRALMPRVQCVRDPELDALYPAQWPARVTVLTTDGRRLTARTQYPKGDPQNPLTWDELAEKFAVMARSVDGGRRQRVLEKVRAFEALASVKTLTDELL